MSISKPVSTPYRSAADSKRFLVAQVSKQRHQCDTSDQRRMQQNFLLPGAEPPFGLALVARQGYMRRKMLIKRVGTSIRGVGMTAFHEK
ncbi:hypothetical protein [Chromobacterium haemolyticum]|uniref:hypothetical protein n=1 Tax=Chromobacterium haemolyticum TaxID=394935 RepID=UPI0012F768ED|nr:hypothetical protein [Chromobacterium haemolyticum]